MSNRLKGSKRDDFERKFNEDRKQLNETVLKLHIKLMQPKIHFFNRLKEREISGIVAMKCMSSVLRRYNKRLSCIIKPTPFTFKQGDVVIAVMAEPSLNRVCGHIDDGVPTICVMPLTIYQHNNLLRKVNYDNLLVV